MILLMPTVLRVHADLVRLRVVTRMHRPNRVRSALILAHKIRPWAAEDRRADGNLTDGRADEATALLVAFASTPTAFGHVYATILVTAALVRDQVYRQGYRLDMSAKALVRLIADTMSQDEVDLGSIALRLGMLMDREDTRRKNPDRRTRRGVAGAREGSAGAPASGGVLRG